MKIPQQITLAGKQWRIIRERDMPKRLSKHRGMYAQGLYGLTLFDTREILLADGLTHEQEGVTLVHELLHAVFHASGDETLGASGEERVIESIDEHLYSLILQLA